MCCALSHDAVIGPFFFADTSMTANINLDMLQNYAILQTQHIQPTAVFQHDGALPHWRTDVRALLGTTFPNRWIGRRGPIALPPRSADVTPLDFISWATSKTKSTEGDYGNATADMDGTGLLAGYPQGY
ncbi:hypothetical protein AVEN_166158-1 [Araneus ventricosus]|uniref:Tc1-like transposase DDE domain-containing protein n=1 Tax=Araneus ventricosus TaxID=182803 RepID=A0A4Y2WYM5_ARAVE|nr:hypothetical protein AVEN_232184-1 [Araneus ventricosus]GBO39325.1 hypothetical protein AVEN_32130-1 [Araneus ventricosus]GBO42355.1 hypothetical protein AVEN_141493-1 [Araneus ventricosus]GBO42359.1 hypothetical protein AVEN_166158-1 [Araneus ventricosus]